MTKCLCSKWASFGPAIQPDGATSTSKHAHVCKACMQANPVLYCGYIDLTSKRCDATHPETGERCTSRSPKFGPAIYYGSGKPTRHAHVCGTCVKAQPVKYSGYIDLVHIRCNSIDPQTGERCTSIPVFGPSTHPDGTKSSRKHAHVCGACVKAQPAKYCNYIDLLNKRCDAINPETGEQCGSICPRFGPATQPDGTPSSSTHAHVCGICAKARPDIYPNYTDIANKRCDAIHPQTGMRCTSVSFLFGPSVQPDGTPSSRVHAHICGSCLRSQPDKYSNYINLRSKRCDATDVETGERCTSISPVFGPATQSDGTPSTRKHAHVCGACIKAHPTQYSDYINLHSKRCDAIHPETGERCTSISHAFGPAVQDDGTPSSGKHAHVCGKCAKAQPTLYPGYVDLTHPRCRSCSVQQSSGSKKNHMCYRCYNTWCMKDMTPTELAAFVQKWNVCRRSKELSIYASILKDGSRAYTFNAHVSVCLDGGETTRGYYPDLYTAKTIDGITYPTIIVEHLEIDEHGHLGNAYSCDRERVTNIHAESVKQHQVVAPNTHVHSLVFRFNPDECFVPGRGKIGSMFIRREHTIIPSKLYAERFKAFMALMDAYSARLEADIRAGESVPGLWFVYINYNPTSPHVLGALEDASKDLLRVDLEYI